MVGCKQLMVLGEGYRSFRQFSFNFMKVWNLQTKSKKATPWVNLRVDYYCHFAHLVVVVVYLLSRVQLFATPWTVAQEAPLSVELCRQEYWSWLPFPPPEDLPDLGIEPTSPPLSGRFFVHASERKLMYNSYCKRILASMRMKNCCNHSAETIRRTSNSQRATRAERGYSHQRSRVERIWERRSLESSFEVWDRDLFWLFSYLSQ